MKEGRLKKSWRLSKRRREYIVRKEMVNNIKCFESKDQKQHGIIGSDNSETVGDTGMNGIHKVWLRS